MPGLECLLPRELLDAPTVLAARCGFDLCHKCILYLYLSWGQCVPLRSPHQELVPAAGGSGWL